MKLTNIVSAALNGAVIFGAVVFGTTSIQSAAAESRALQITQEDRYCLQQNMYFEARNLSDVSMQAVGWVTLNRMEDDRFPDSVCDVVWQRKQFSWTHDGKSDKPSDNVIEQRAWVRAKKAADTVVTNWSLDRPDITSGATHYHADWVNPFWASDLDRISQIEAHIFYRWN